MTYLAYSFLTLTYYIKWLPKLITGLKRKEGNIHAWIDSANFVFEVETIDVKTIYKFTLLRLLDVLLQLDILYIEH